MKRNVVDPFAKFQKEFLANGLQIYAYHADLPCVYVFVNVHVGSLCDMQGKEGLVHFVEHLLANNVAGYANQLEVEKFFEKTGGYANLGTTNIFANWYSFKIPADSRILKKALRLFGTMLLNSVFSSETVENQRKIIVREFNNKFVHRAMFEDFSLRRYQMLFHDTVFRNYKASSIGTPETVITITKEDLQNFYTQYFVPQNMSIVVVGDIPNEDVFCITENSLFGQARQGTKAKRLQKFSAVSLPLETMNLMHLGKYLKDGAGFIDNAYYETSVLFPGEMNPMIFSLLAKMLRVLLFEEIRVRTGESYYFSAIVEDLIEVHNLIIRGNVNPRIVDLVEDMVVKCLSQVEKREDLFEFFKQKTLKEKLLWDFNGGGLCKAAAEDLCKFGKVETMQDMLTSIKKVLFSDVLAVVKYMLPLERRWTNIHKP